MSKRPSSCVISSRISDVTLAELHYFWASRNETNSSLSELVRTSCEALSVLLRQNGMLNSCPNFDHMSARTYLVQQGLETKSMKNKNLQKHMQAIQTEQACELFRQHAPEPTVSQPSQYYDTDVFQKVLAELNQCTSPGHAVKVMAEEAEQRDRFSIQTNEEADLRDQLLGAIPECMPTTVK